MKLTEYHDDFKYIGLQCIKIAVILYGKVKLKVELILKAEK